MDVKISLKIRIIKNCDIDLCAAIEARTVPDAWGTDRIKKERYLNKSRAGYVVLVDNEIAGYTIIEHSDDYVTIIRLVVDNDYRMNGCGRALFNKINKFGKSIDAWIPETAVDMQKFLRHLGFKAQSRANPKFRDPNKKVLVKKQINKDDAEYYFLLEI
jgi:ribosomal protein S18 acetylase RimI-like enzyme